MATHRYRPADENSFAPYKAQPLPLERPVAVYYRQSSEGQIGNISTTLQTVDMVEHLMRQGWERERILMIDMDAGLSGTKKINERPGMAYLYSLIEGSEIGLVASQDVDRFFRDMTMIETNIFIDACRRNNVLVLTPTFIYDLAHPTQGRYHMQMFRDQAQRTADYLEFHIKGRLVKSRHYLDALGLWAGCSIPVGYMVDLRPKLLDGTQNPEYRKFVRFALYADVVERYFELFCELEFNGARTGRHIEAHGPFFPELTDEMIPEGFRAELNIKTRSRITGGLMLFDAGLRHLFTNVVYIGGWVQNEVVVRTNNHEPIVPPALFMQVFNYMSSIQFDGSPNPNYVPYRPFNRLPEAMRGCEPPIYSSLVYSDDVPGKPRKRVITNYKITGDSTLTYWLPATAKMCGPCGRSQLMTW